MGIRAPRVSSVRMASSVPPRLSWVVVGSAVILSAAPAQASTVTVVQVDGCNGDVACQKYGAAGPVPVTVVAGAPGEANRITITRVGETWVVRDDGAPLTGCSPCPVTPGGLGIPGLRVSLGDGDDTLTLATPDDTVVAAGDGADTVTGGPEDDVVDGGPGADRLIGGGGQDTLSFAGRRTPVRVDAGTGWSSDGDAFRGFHTIIGGDAADALRGSAGRDSLDGGPGNDRLYGLGGRDILVGGRGADELYGGAGDDRISGDPPQGDGYYTPIIRRRADRVDCGPGRDRITADRRDITRNCHP